jgi:hypothetical protein
MGKRKVDASSRVADDRTRQVSRRYFLLPQIQFLLIYVFVRLAQPSKPTGHICQAQARPPQEGYGALADVRRRSLPSDILDSRFYAPPATSGEFEKVVLL